MDSLSQTLQNLDVRAEVFFNGQLCGLQRFEDEATSGMLHFLKAGALSVTTQGGHKLDILPHSVLFFPRGMQHTIQVMSEPGADLVCAAIHYPSKQQALISQALPTFIYTSTEVNQALSNTTEWLFQEALDELKGHKIVIDRLCDVFMVQLLRHVIDNGTVSFGLIAGGAHPQLSPLMDRLKAAPEQEWTVETMAESVAMSRSKFFSLFKETTGQAPMDYLTDLRLAVAKGLLKSNRPVGVVANTVGYENASTLSRVFKRRLGITPKQWIKNYLQK